MFGHEHDEIRLLEKILDELREIKNRLPRRARSATLRFITSQGAFMDLTAHVNDKPGVASFAEFDGPNGSGNKVPPVGAVSFASSDPTVATVDASSGALVYLSAGSTTISGADAGNALTASAVLTLIASLAVSATLTLTAGQ